MKIKPAITAAVRAAVMTATIDPDAPREPKDMRVRFDIERLARVVELMKGADGYLSVIEACDEEMRRQLMEDNDVQRALAALLLKERVTGPRDRRYREGPNGWELVS